MKAKFYPETDDHGEIIHNHFDCPSCLKKRASTSVYGDIRNLPEDDLEFECEECGAEFSFVADKPSTDIVNSSLEDFPVLSPLDALKMAIDRTYGAVFIREYEIVER